MTSTSRPRRTNSPPGGTALGTWLRRCWNCDAAIGARDRFCARCGARQRDPNRLEKIQTVYVTRRLRRVPWSVLSGTGILDRNGLEKRVTEDPVRFRSSVQIGYSLIEVGFGHDPRFKGGLPNTLDHCGKSLPCESFDQIGLAGVDVDHSRRDMNLAKTSFRQQGVKRPSYQRIPPRSCLQLHLATDSPARIFAVRIEVGGAMIAFDHRDGSTRLQDVFQCSQRLDGLGQMFKDEAQEHMIE